jgi:hypothetical protein
LVLTGEATNVCDDDMPDGLEKVDTVLVGLEATDCLFLPKDFWSQK